jgi:hypothetical protein
MELHDDDPKMFKIMLKFIYTGVYDMSDALSELPYNDIENSLLLTVQAGIIADKYNIEKMLDPAAKDLGQQLRIWGMHDILGKVVQAHYDDCTWVGSALGKAITAEINAHFRDWKRTKLFKELTRDYAEFATDLLWTAMDLWDDTKLQGRPPSP